MPDILESEQEGRVDTNFCLEESWESQGIPFTTLAFGYAWGRASHTHKCGFGRVVLIKKINCTRRKKIV